MEPCSTPYIIVCDFENVPYCLCPPIAFYLLDSFRIVYMFELFTSNTIVLQFFNNTS